MATTDALAAALEGIDGLLAKQRDGDGVSIKEISTHTGKGIKPVREWMSIEIDAGRWEFAGRRSGQTIDGRKSSTPIYRPTNNP